MDQNKGNVVIVGVLNHKDSTNVYMAKAFEKRGHTVIPVNYRHILQHYGHNTLFKVLDDLSKEKPALMLFSKCNGVSSNAIAKCSLNTKTWFWFMDGMNTLSHLPECHTHAQLAHYTSCTGLGVINYLKKKFGTNEHMYHIMEGIDQEVYRPTMALNDFVADVSFIGTANAERTDMLEALARVGLNVRAYGPGFNEEILGSNFCSVCSSSKIMLASSAEHGTQEYFSDRVFRYGACGAFVLHRYSPGMQKYFQIGQDLVYFKTNDDLIDLAIEYVKDERAQERAMMAQNLHNKVLQHHTWDAVVEKICSIADI